MKLYKTILILLVIPTGACHTTRNISKSTSSSVPALTVTTVPSTATVTTVTSSNVSHVQSTNGIYVPGNEELIAIQKHYKEVTLNKLKEGYTLYTAGACIKCHEAMNIYKRGEAQWVTIIDDMAQKAAISDEQKDAVYKYVLSVKAVQNTSTK